MKVLLCALIDFTYGCTTCLYELFVLVLSDVIGIRSLGKGSKW